MPELPEVETVRRGLAPYIVGETIKSVALSSKPLRRPFAPNMAARLKGAVIKSLSRRGKYLLAPLSTNETLIIHLGMSGRVQISKNPLADFYHDRALNPKHNHVIFDFLNATRFVFNDPRRFGMVDLRENSAVFEQSYLKTLGPEPLSNSFTAPYLKTRLKGKKSPIKVALLDQRLVSGIGNIYASEALFRAGISPLKNAGSIANIRLERLVGAIRQTLEDAIAAGGSSLRDHRQIDGALGYFQHHFNVYDRAEKNCQAAQCGGKIRKVIQGGRASFYCPKCQN